MKSIDFSPALGPPIPVKNGREILTSNVCVPSTGQGHCRRTSTVKPCVSTGLISFIVMGFGLVAMRTMVVLPPLLSLPLPENVNSCAVAVEVTMPINKRIMRLWVFIVSSFQGMERDLEKAVELLNMHHLRAIILRGPVLCITFAAEVGRGPD